MAQKQATFEAVNPPVRSVGPAGGRDIGIDVLRALGLALVMLAHTAPPEALFLARNFDVVLLVLASGMSFALSKSTKDLIPYLWARFKRLIAPVWLFLTFLFAALYLVPPTRSEVTPALLLDSYLMVGGIGYVWIMRVFLTVALFAPLGLALSRRFASTRAFYAMATLAVLAYCVLAYALVGQAASAGASEAGGNHSPLSVLLQTISYSLVFLMGVRIHATSARERLGLAVFWFAIFVGSVVLMTGGVISTQAYKFPPQLPYLSYGLFASFLATFCVTGLPAGAAQSAWFRVVGFVASNSIWIYLWHILFVLAHRKLNIFGTWYIAFPVTLVLSTGIVYVQRRIIALIERRAILGPGAMRTVKMLLTG